MKLARFNGGKLGVVESDRIVDVTHLSPVSAGIWPPVADLAFLARFEELHSRIEDLLHSARGIPLGDVRLDAPIAWPHNIVAFPANYQAHREEMLSPNRADKNGFFLKATSSLAGPRDAIVLPELPGREVHHECELAIVVGRAGRHITREAALDHVLGFSCLLDITVRGGEERVMRKSFDTFTPVGPWIVTKDEVPDADALDIELTVNGETRQQGNTRDFLVDVRDMVVMTSSVMTLQPGDIIATGTPAGVGPILPGDEVKVDIEKIGSMTLPVVQGEGGSNLAFEFAAREAAAGR
jgi:2-keto-4-pentenoate hydratase/2-oxohepta-3-ene-1,7-dioic acid hydratase in catechol pathway